MPRARALAVVVLLVSYGAVGARQPAVRTSAPLPSPSADIAQGLAIPVPDRSRLMLDIVRLVFDAPDGQDEGDRQLRGRLRDLMLGKTTDAAETIPLPLDRSIWRETIFGRQVADAEIVPAILADRRLALLYHGLAALDDETLAWLGPERETLHHMIRHAGAFATFGRSIQIRAGRIAVPGGEDAEPLWESVVGVSVTKPGVFLRRLYGGTSGRLPFLYDAIAHLDPARQRFALGFGVEATARVDRLRSLADVFEAIATDWRVEERPFARPQMDPSLTLSVVAVTPEGRLIGPANREMWDRIFRGDDAPVLTYSEVSASDLRTDQESITVDAAWLAARVHRVPSSIGRRRLETFLFAQRAFHDRAAGDPVMASALRAVSTFPALMASLERAGITSAPLMASAATRARSIEDIDDDAARRAATAQFQSLLGIIERAARTGGLSRADAAARIASLVAVDPTPNGYEDRISLWIRRDLLPALPAADVDSPNPLEDALLSAMAGVQARADADPQVEWEGRSYRVNAARAELLRLRRVRERQGGLSLDATLAKAQTGPHREPAAPKAALPGVKIARGMDTPLVETLVSIVYAPALGDPAGEALTGGNVALRHEFGWTRGPVRTTMAWKIPGELFGSSQGWRVTGSLLGLDVALSRLAARRLDSGEMPAEPRLTSNERQTMFLTVALMLPSAMTDATRDEIAAAVGRGRARAAALTSDREQIERVAREAGLSEWRREALAWTVEHDRARIVDQFALSELMWLGAPRGSAAVALDPWGAAALPLTGCICLEMPRAKDWEYLAGRPASGLMATRGTDVAVLVAETLADLKLPAALAPGIVAFAMQDVMDRAQPAYFSDWLAFSRAATALPRERIVDYVAALTSGGPLLPVPADDRLP